MNNQSFNGFFAIVAWAVVIILMILISKTKLGYTILFFFVIASILVVLAIGSPTITAIFQAASPTVTKQSVNQFTTGGTTS